MAKLNIAEKRLPQDGRIELKIADRLVDVRVSADPTAFGERSGAASSGQIGQYSDAFGSGHARRANQAARQSDQVTLRNYPGDGAYRQRENHNVVCGAFHHQPAGNQHHYH